MKVNEIHHNPNNPRIIKDDKFLKLVQSIKEFPEMLELRPIVIDETNMVLGGNMRLKACIEAGLKDVPVKVAKGLTEEQKKEFIIKDNVGFGEWNWDDLANEWNIEDLSNWGLDLPLDSHGLDDKYSGKIGEVVYEPKNTGHAIEDLFEIETKFDDEINQLENEELKVLLRARVSFFYNFKFAKIADYYAYQATEPEKAIIEKMGLVLLDKDKLIENGFYNLIAELTETEYE